MAWNPAPEVAVARDAASCLQAATGSPVNRCVLLFTTADGKIGYASYGQDRALCAETKQLADVLFDAARQWFSEQ